MDLDTRLILAGMYVSIFHTLLLRVCVSHPGIFHL